MSTRKRPGPDRVALYAKARRKSRSAHLGDLESVAERYRELAEELSVTTDRIKVLAIGEQRKVLANLTELYGLADQSDELRRLSEQLASEREERSRMESGIEFTNATDDLHSIPLTDFGEAQ